MKRFLSVGAAGILILSSAVLTTQPAQAATPSYSVMLLQPYNNQMKHSHANALNNHGDVVGFSSPAVPGIDGGGHTTVWKARSGKGAWLGAAFPNSMATGISDDGKIVGSYMMSSPPWAYFHQGGTTLPIDIDAAHIGAAAMSSNGVAIINVTRQEGQVHTATSPTSLTQLPTPPGTEWPQGTGISPNGRNIAGHTVDGGSRPVLWRDGTATVLPLPSGVPNAVLWDVNDAGVAVGCSSNTGTLAAFSYSAAGTPTRLPSLSGSTCAQAINNSGLMVGFSGGKAALWSGGSVVDLNTLLPSTDGFTLTSASDVNASGQIVGTARLADGTSRGFVATPSNATTIYTTPGLHEFNDRQWKTTCEPYSQTMRCRTEIVATVVRTINGQHTRVTDWAFNNLTYLPSDRALWAGNPLGNTGTWTASDGRQWRTECDTAATGRNGCRSYARVTVVTATPRTGGGWTYTSENMFVFNNIVQFHA